MDVSFIKSIMAGCGMPDIGICKFSRLADSLINCRAKARIPDNADSVIVAVFPYRVTVERTVNISRYAAVPDYHKVCGDMLNAAAGRLLMEYPDNLFVPFIDNSPIHEVKAAVLAGLGVLGDNGLLITPDYGSYVFIGEIVTDLSLEATESYACCSGCGQCSSVCPADCINTAKGECISAITQKKGELTANEITLIKKSGSVFGCDICQEVCPMNSGKKLTGIKAFVDGYKDEYCAGDPACGRAFEWRGENVVKRNAAIIKED